MTFHTPALGIDVALLVASSSSGYLRIPFGCSHVPPSVLLRLRLYRCPFLLVKRSLNDVALVPMLGIILCSLCYPQPGESDQRRNDTECSTRHSTPGV